MNHPQLSSAIHLLQRIIEIPSLSKNEDKVCQYLQHFLTNHKIDTYRCANNLWATNLHFNKNLPTILLNSHVDTVPPNKHYTLDPYKPLIREEKIYGLGSNDAGASVVCQLINFLQLYDTILPFNLVWTATAEEEISGNGGITLLLKDPQFNLSIPNKNIIGAIVGEPTNMKMAVAERGLMVIDAYSSGEACHVANSNGKNAIYAALDDIEQLKNIFFDRHSEHLGYTNLQITQINSSNKSHNIIPGDCHFVMDIRINDCYTHEEVLEIIQQKCSSTIQPRSMRLKSSIIQSEHPIVVAGHKLGWESYGSFSLSDKALIPFPSLKCGPGDTLRSHTSDEFIYIQDLNEGLYGYHQLLTTITI